MAKSKKPASAGKQKKPGPAAKPAAPTTKATKPAKSAPAPAAKPAKPAPAPAAKPAKPAPAPAAAKASKKGKSSQSAPPAVIALTAVSSGVTFRLVILGTDGPETFTDGADETIVSPPTLFAVEPAPPSERRYLFLIQKDGDDRIVLLAVVDGAGEARVPAAPGWQRAIVAGTIHLIASDQLLTREEIVEIIGGHEPQLPPARPPYT